MAESAAYLVDQVIPRVPVRQWVLSFPIPLRILLIEDPAVVRAILTHLGLWQPEALERAPPAPARA